MYGEDQNLMDLFVEDFATQLNLYNNALLELMRVPNSHVAYESLFRIFHSMKSIFLTIEQNEVGSFFHRIESVFRFLMKYEEPVVLRWDDFLVRLKVELEHYYQVIQTDRDLSFECSSFEISLCEIEKQVSLLNASLGVSEEIPPRQKLYEQLKMAELAYLEMIDTTIGIKGFAKLTDVFSKCKSLSAELKEQRLIDLFEGINRLVEDYQQREITMDHMAEGLIMETFDWASKLVDLKHTLKSEEERNLMVHIDMLQPQRLRYLNQITENQNITSAGTSQKLGEILVQQGKVKETEIDDVIHRQKEGQLALKLGEALLVENKVKIRDIATALQVQERNRFEPEPFTYIRIPEKKVDVLVDGMEELMILQAQLKEKLRKRWIESDLGTKLQMDRIDRLLILLQHQAASFRLTSLETTFKKIEIIGRNTAKELHKNLNFELIGTEIEANRSIVERLQSPIMHLVRNAIYHGIEDQKERELCGKGPIGNLKVSGFIDHNELAIQISDDGRGLDLGKIRKKAISYGLANENQKYPDWEIIDFIFEPGFSTNEAVDQISGRGLGLNIVESEIKALGGHIEIKNRPGYGVSFVLRVPLHTNQMEGTLVKIEEEQLMISSQDIVEILSGQEVKWGHDDVKTWITRENGERLTLIPIHEYLEIPFDKNRLETSKIIVLAHLGRKIALPITDWIDQRIIYMNPIEASLREDTVFQGVSVVNDHEFALILDTEKLFMLS